MKPYLIIISLLLLVSEVIALQQISNFFKWQSKAPSTLQHDPSKEFPIVGSSKVDLTTAVNSYFESWNKRDMISAVSVFADDCEYEDTLYPDVFKSKVALEKHLINVASALPSSFLFIIDNLSVAEDKLTVGVQWHLESEGKVLPFTRGASMYVFNAEGYIIKGFDVPEPVIKSGSISLQILKSAKTIIQEPQRLFAVGAWVFYVWYVFLSDVAPGPNALTLDPKTWNEVFHLSFNYLLISPVFLPSITPVEHPWLESLFNVVLLYATLFFGFVTDGKPNNIPILSSTTSKTYSNPTTTDAAVTPTESEGNAMVPTLIGMQLLTNAFLLPYLITRPKPTTPTITSPLTGIEKAGESKLLPGIVFGFSMLCVYWLLEGRADVYGSLQERYESFKTLISTDRLSFSFLVDILYFSVFQGWLMDDDYARRVADKSSLGKLR